jgi:hypothetical protein
MRVVGFFVIGAFVAAAACGQTAVEHAGATAGASAAAAGASGAGKSIGGVFRSLSDTLDKAGKATAGGSPPATSVTTVSAAPKQASRPAPVSKPVDPSQVTVGLYGVEVIKRFGEPVMRLTETSNSQLVETLWYKTTTDDQIEIKLSAGKVVSIRLPESKKQEEEAHN